MRQESKYGLQGRLCAFFATMSLLGCSAENAAVNKGITVATENGSAQDFETAIEMQFDGAGKTEIVTTPLGNGYGSLVVRARYPELLAENRPCMQLDSVTDSNGLAWIPPADTKADWGDYCTTCMQRASVATGYGLFVFPNDGEALSSAESVSMRLVLRDCATRLPFDPAFHGPVPDSIIVETMRLPPEESMQRRRLPVIFGFGQGAQFKSSNASIDPVFVAARQRLEMVLDLGQIDLDIRGFVDFPVVADPLEYSNANTAKLDATEQAVILEAERNGMTTTDALMVIFSSCIIHEDNLGGPTMQPYGIATHLPSGYAVDGHTSAVFIRGTSCDSASQPWLSAEALGKVLSHEVAHALGLYHSVESNGAEDHLIDTDENNLMNFFPLTIAADGLSARQINVIRNHPLVRQR